MLGFLLLFLGFVPNSNIIVNRQLNNFQNILITKDIPCHIATSRIKTFESALLKHSKNKYKHKSIYELHDLIAFRFVFYNKEDLLKFYHFNKHDKDIVYMKNYIHEPKENGYKAIHFHYRIENENIDRLECQLFIMDDYYDSLYGNSSIYK